MAGVTAVLGATAAAASLGKGLYDTIDSAKKSKSALKKIESYDRQDLNNVYAGMSAPTAGIEMQKQQAQQQQADLSNMLAQSPNSAIGGAMALAQQGRISMKDIGNQLDQAMLNIKQLQAGDEERMRSMREAREQEDIAGLGAEYAYQRSRGDAGVGRIVQTVGNMAELSMDAMSDEEKSMRFKNRVDKKTERIADRFERESRIW
jgi:hypothetical protein